MLENLSLFPLDPYDGLSSRDNKSQRTGTFIDNMKLPIHRWFRYSAGFSSEWVQKLLKSKLQNSGRVILDPFAGSGTTLLSADDLGYRSVGIEAHPFVARIAKAKLLWNSSITTFRAYSNEVIDYAKSCQDFDSQFPFLIERCFSKSSLAELAGLRTAWLATKNDDAASDLVWLAISAILRPTSSAGTAQWQYILPNKVKKTVTRPFEAYQSQIDMMEFDMLTCQSKTQSSLARMITGDARTCPDIDNQSIDIVVTSPPYANNYDYADATRLEMSFWGEVQSWSDLHNAARQFLITSSTQHASKDKLSLEAILESPFLDSIRSEIAPICRTLEKERLLHGGKKHYHTMIAAYFEDMAKVWVELRRICKPKSECCFVIGDSAPYGIYVPVDKWLGELALGAGFKSFTFEKIRDRNIKWKNRKHRIPLKEGHLWVIN